ncbi:uncharacterized protein LOC117297684 [Asterias rubens]|uniref:uncharacterized protein LOC117297684 n=1 Tax=Asterias rubens TaxID=7604 RepID=UPI0014559517|nr:uncharacterized protein LOC117297684 [Asterias rubens]
MTATTVCGLAVTDEQAFAGAVVQFKCSTALSAQYISLEITTEYSPYLEIAEVAVKQYKSEECVPSNTLTFNDDSTSASSFKNPAHDAVDGNLNTFSTTIAKEIDSTHWWLLDLGDTHWVGKVTVFLKSVYGSISVRTGNSSDYAENTLCAQLTATLVLEFVCTKLTLARYVSVDVQLASQRVLQITEVFIKEFASGECQASQKAEVRATSLSPWYGSGYGAEKAVDSNLNTLAQTGTSNENPLWLMELTYESWLTRVTVAIKTPGYHFIGAVVRVGPSPHNLTVTCGAPATESQCQPSAVIHFLCDRPTLARYVSLSIDTNGSRQAVLQIVEVMVDDYENEECAPTNDVLSNGWTASQTNTISSSANALDGNINTYFETAHGDDHPWWKLDLGDNYWLGVIAVTLRTDYYAHGFLDVVARAGPNLDYSMNPACALVGPEPDILAGSVVQFLCNPPVLARYISLDINQAGPSMLQIAEVVVKEYNSMDCVTNDTLFAYDWTATQSSDFANKPARVATNGRISTYSSTLRELHPWVRFDLGSEHWLGRISLVLASSQYVTATVRAGPSTDYAENTQCGLAITASEHQVWALVERVCDPPMMARYITMDVQHPTSPTALVVLRIADIAIKKYASEECARNSTSTVINGKARQSSETEKYPASNANDGNPGTYFKSANFVIDPQPWWQVDLVDSHCIGKITVTFQDNTLDGNVKAKVCANGTDFSTNEQCGLQCTPTRVSDTVQYFLCDPPSYVRYIILAVKPSADVSTPETVHLKIAEVTVEQHLSGVGPCLNWDDPKRKTKAAYISKKLKGSLTTSEGALNPLSTAVTSSLKQCISDCLHHTSCISIIFSTLGAECSLYSRYQSDLFRLSDEEDSYWLIELSE